MKKADGYKICREISPHRFCGCEQRGENPCTHIGVLLKSTELDPDEAIKAERQRIERNIKVSK